MRLAAIALPLLRDRGLGAGRTCWSVAASKQPAYPEIPPMKLTGNTVLVTGGTSGIGRALAEALHDRGNRVIVTGRRQDLLDEIASARPGLVGLQLDVDDTASLSRLSKQLRDSFPQLNVLFANAGISRSEDMTSDAWTAADAETIVQTNVLGVMRTAAAFLPLIKRKPHATFLATGSALAFVPRADFPAYCASKAFLHSWLQSMRHQLRRIPVEVLELSAPYVQTELTGATGPRSPRHAAGRLRGRGAPNSGSRRNGARRGSSRARCRPSLVRARWSLRSHLCCHEPGLRAHSRPP